ncbi:MAG: ABC transporter ATP-binding protein [Victivallaceae bacterium]|nr:ABC transporter ATP-binding protein [Victivallaceae bacterium]
MLKYLKRALCRKRPDCRLNEKIAPGRLPAKLKYLLPSVRKHWRSGVISGIMLVLASVLSWPLPMIVKYLIDNVIARKQLHLILPAVGVIAVLSLLMVIAELLENFFIAKFTEETVFDLRERLLNKVFSLPKSFFDKNHSGYILSRISYDLQGIKFFISGTIARLFIETVKLTGGIIFLFYLEWKIALPVLITLPFSFLLTRFFAWRTYAVSHESCELNAELNASYLEAVGNSQLIKAYCNEQKAVKGILNKALESIHIFYESTLLNALSSVINRLMPSLAKILVLIMGSYWVITGYWEIGTLIAYLVYLSYVYNPVNHLSTSINQFQSGRANLDRIVAIFEMMPEENSDHGRKIEKLDGDIEFKDVSFYYTKEKAVINKFSIKINRGERWAISGESGIGKTTLVSLIMRFYIPQEGQILFDGINAADINVRYLRRRIGYVSQNIQLISGTIMDNLRYGNSEADRREITRIAEKTRIHEFIESLPEKYDTVLGEGGVNLSEGQKQRISLARALLKEADIIILDEPTASLDNTTENSICEMLKNYFRAKTVFIIAHSPETIKLADNFILLRENRPILSGKMNDYVNAPN